jgi:hypothetical protein
MHTVATPLHAEAAYPVRVHVMPALTRRNRLTVAFRPLLALPHFLLVGGPVAAGAWWAWHAEAGSRQDWIVNWGVFGSVAVVAAVISWFAILFADRHPDGLWELGEYYLRWRVRSVAYLALLRDEYPPFGDGRYPALMYLTRPVGPRDKPTVVLRLILVLPHVLLLSLLGFAWAVSTAIAWCSILITGRFPEPLYRFGVGMLRWNIRLEAYALLLRDEFPPFSLDD